MLSGITILRSYVMGLCAHKEVVIRSSNMIKAFFIKKIDALLTFKFVSYSNCNRNIAGLIIIEIPVVIIFEFKP